MNSGSNQPTCKKIQNYIFKFSDLLGQGNFSKVYKAHNEVTNQTVAIKIVQLNSLKSRKLQQLLFSQIEVLKKLNHPNILRCFEVFTSNRNCYIITELCNQGDLESKLGVNKFFSEEKAIPIIKDIYKGLEYLAEKNVIHRDLKIANIFMHNGKAKIADFGFAKFTKSKFKDINIGSPIYMSPQGLIDNVYGPKTDVWAFGIMMFEFLHGETPFSHCRTESELKYSISIPISCSRLKNQLSGQIKQAVLKCLEVKQDKRYSIMQLKGMPFFKKMLHSIQSENNISPWIYKSINQITKSKSSAQQNTKKSQSHKATNKQSVSFNWKDSEPSNSDNNNTNFSKNNKSYSKQQPITKQEYYQNQYPNQHQHHGYSHNQSPSYQDNANNSKTQTNIQRQSSFPQSSFYNNQQQNRDNLPCSLGTQQNPNKILSTAVTFKTCVNILHYCRLIYKYVSIVGVLKVKELKVLSDQGQKNVFVGWLAIVVKTVNGRIDNRQVIYEGENAGLRQQKLRQVSKQYQKKYSKELNLNLQKINPGESSMANYDYMANYLYKIYQDIDSFLSESAFRQNKNLLILGHYIVMIYQATRFLKKCYDEQNYKPFQNYKEVQTLLNMKKEEMDLPSYWWYKKKFISSKK